MPTACGLFETHLTVDDPERSIAFYATSSVCRSRCCLSARPSSALARRCGTDDLATAAVRVERHAGPRAELRPLFEQAEDSAQELDGYIDEGEVLVAIAEDRVIGHLQLIANREGDGSEIKNMAVEATHRGHGIGRLLIQRAIDQARSDGHSALTVATAAADVGNLRFYQRAGFRMRQIERDAFLPAVGYPAGLTVDGIRLCDRVWLDLELDPVNA